MQPSVVRTPIGDKELIIETGKLAKQAGGAAVVTFGETVVIVTAVASGSTRDELDFSRSRSTTARKPPRRAGSPAAISSAKDVRPKRRFSPRV